MVKVVLIFAGAVLVLNAVGFNLTTVLAGVGIGGIAIAFAAQKTLENLFGGVSVLGDEAIRVGDVCRFGTIVGTIEDIGLRSTRVRTAERVELSIPNGSLATMNIENLSKRDKFLFNNTIGLRGDSTRDQLLFCLAEIRKLLYAHPKIEADSARIRLVAFGESSFDMEIFCYIKTTDAASSSPFVRTCCCGSWDIVESSGTSLANPAQTVYFTRDPGMNEKNAEHAAKTVERWRETKLSPSRISCRRKSLNSAERFHILRRIRSWRPTICGAESGGEFAAKVAAARGRECACSCGYLRPAREKPLECSRPTPAPEENRPGA